MVKIKLDGESIRRDVKKKEKTVTVIAQKTYSEVCWDLIFPEI